LEDDQLGISYGEPNDSNDINVTVAISFPSGNNPIHEKCFKMPEGEKIRITWTISELKKPNVAQYWKAIDHYSTLPYSRIPDNGIDFFKDFILRLEAKWKELCDLGEDHLTDYVS
jgi:hypothetical protein